MFRPLTQVARIACFFVAVGCAGPEELKSPPATGSGGQTSSDVGGAQSTGGTSATPTTAVDTGGAAIATGGKVGQGGAKHSGGAITTDGGVVGNGGATAVQPTANLVMTWTKGAGANDSSEVDVKLPAGAEAVLASRITLTYCGAGAGQMIQKTDLKFDQASLICPSNVSTGDCTYGQNYPMTPVITVTGTARDCCYALSLGTIAHSLVDGTGGMIKLVYRFEQTGIGLNYTYESTWTVFLDDAPAMHCTLGEWVATGTAPITCGT